MSGGNAAIAVGFGTYLGAFVPFFGVDHVLVTLPLGAWSWTLNGAQVAAVAAVLALTAINARGLAAGAGAQNALTWLKAAAIGFLVLAGLLLPARVDPEWTAPFRRDRAAVVLLGVAGVSALLTYDGWYGAIFSARASCATWDAACRAASSTAAAVTLVYLAINAVYARALAPADMAAARIMRRGPALAGAFAWKWAAAAIPSDPGLPRLDYPLLVAPLRADGGGRRSSAP
jgi:APA family basic amino acid/polyamine antiporter